MDEHLTMEEQLVALMRRDEIRSRERTICISRFWRYPGPTTAEHEADLPARDGLDLRIGRPTSLAAFW
jgi:hypothetical protein